MGSLTEPLAAPGEQLRIDKDSGAVRARRYTLTVASGPDAGSTVPVDATVLVGTGDDCTLVLTDGTVSRQHLELVPRLGGVRLRDLRSRNGTSIGGAKVTDAFVERETSVLVGKTLLHLSVEEAEVEAPVVDPKSLGLVGRSAALRRVCGLLEKLAPTDTPVVLQGETGTGKDVLARALHRLSARAGAPFVVLDCSAVSPQLVESELFGHVKGAFTGAAADRKGAFQQAHQGTVFLDEIGELPLEHQPKLLRVLEQGTVKRVGDDTHREVDVRVVAATHRDLAAMVRAGTFREDLFFRLAVAPVRVPPLRERLEDVPLLVQHFVKELGRLDFVPPSSLLAQLASYPWPGNVRELRNVVQRVCLGEAVSLGPGGPSRAPQPEVSVAVPFKEAKDKLIERFERDYVEGLLALHGGHVGNAAKAAQLARGYLYKLVHKYDLKVQDPE